jgi:hypothetical protein
MNEHQPGRPSEPTVGAVEMAEQPAIDAVTETVAPDEYADAPPVAEPVVEYAPERRGVVTINRALFVSILSVGVLAILALGAATTWLALDRRGGPEDPVIATVNGEAIRRSEYDKAVAQGSGQDVLDQLVVERLIAAEAKKRNIAVDEAEAARLLDEQKQQFGDESAFQAALAQAGLTETDLGRQLRLSTMLRQMVADKAAVSDQEVNDAYQATASRYAGMSEAEAKEEIRGGLKQQRENAAARDLLTQLRTEAQIETKLPGKS